MVKVQSQKQQGSGAQAFDFLNEQNKKPAAMEADEDTGFNKMQMQLLEETEAV